jgi:hypothetical protein
MPCKRTQCWIKPTLRSLPEGKRLKRSAEIKIVTIGPQNHSRLVPPTTAKSLCVYLPTGSIPRYTSGCEAGLSAVTPCRLVVQLDMSLLTLGCHPCLGGAGARPRWIWVVSLKKG